MYVPWLNFIRITKSVPGRDGAVTTFIQFRVFYCKNLELHVIEKVTKILDFYSKIP